MNISKIQGSYETSCCYVGIVEAIVSTFFVFVVINVDFLETDEF